MHSDRHAGGFTLIEMSIVISIIAAVVGMILYMGDSMVESARKVNTQQKLDEVEAALTSFRIANDRLPCPTDPAGTSGLEAANPGICTGGAPAAPFVYTIPAGQTNPPPGTTVVEGAVPVKTLNLPAEFQWDGWGRKFGYAVWAPATALPTATAPAPFVAYGAAANCGGITVENAGHGDRSTTADYALISYGPNGHGGYNQTGVRYFAGSDNADEWTDCHCNATADTVYQATYVQENWTQTSAGDSRSVYDDIVRFKDRWQMQNAYDSYYPYSHLPCGNGFITDGVATGDNTGWTVAVGDVNGDGIPDLIIGAPGAPAGPGKVFVVFGTRTGFPDPLPLNNLNGVNGVEFNGPASGYRIGTAVAAGDVNGDGIADIIISSPSNSAVYVIFGHTGAWTSPVTLASGVAPLDGIHGAEFDGPAGSALGASIATGDVNGDGIADLILGASGATVSGTANTGAVFVIFGHTNASYAWNAKTTLTSGTSPLDGTNGAEFDGNPAYKSSAGNPNVGSSVAVGDINGDGIGDIIIGAPDTKVSGHASAGAIYVVFGMKAGWAKQTMLTSNVFPLDGGADGTEFDGAAAGDALGKTTAGNVLATGDVNGDGITDLVIGNQTVNAAYVIFGHTNPWIAQTTLTSLVNPLDGIHGVEFDGAAGSGLGASVAAGDVNGDGIADIILGAPLSGTNAGSAYVIFGHTSTPSGWTAQTTLPSGAGEFDGAAGSVSGDAVAVGDINGDGICDIIIGAPSMNGAAGGVYTYFGRASGNWPATAVTLGGL